MTQGKEKSTKHKALKWDIEQELVDPTMPTRSWSHGKMKTRKEKNNSVENSIKELMGARKEILHNLWEDINESWNNREDFIHMHFRDKAHNTYTPIKNETMRAFEIRWLDIRIQGLIEQRENCLRTLEKLTRPNQTTPTPKRYSHYSPRASMHRNDSPLTGMDIGGIMTPQKSAMTIGSLEYESDMQQQQQQQQEEGEEGQTTTTPDDKKKTKSQFKKQMLEELQIFRSVTLYITEHINSWCEKQPTKTIYMWQNTNSDAKNEEIIDYMKKMATDFVDMCERNRKLQQILTELQLTQTTLVLPKYPQLYYDYDKTTNITASDLLQSTQHALTKKKLERQQQQQQQQKEKKRGVHQEEDDIQGMVRLPSPNPNYRKPRHQKEEESTTFLTETRTEEQMLIDDFEKQFQENAEEKPPLTIETLQQYIELPTLLVQQKAADRHKRHKRYGEPLMSVRHEDLTREALEDQYGVSDSSFGGGILAHSGTSGTNLKYTNQVLSKSFRQRITQHAAGDHSSSMGAGTDMSRSRPAANKLNQTKRVRRSYHHNQSTKQNNKNNTKTTVVFKPPNLAKEMERVKRAQKIIFAHVNT